MVEKHDCMKYLRWIRHSLLKRISLCYYGWWQWRRICKIEGMGRTAVILVTGEDREVSFFALTHLDQLLEKRAFDDAVWKIRQCGHYIRGSSGFEKCPVLFKQITCGS